MGTPLGVPTEHYNYSAYVMTKIASLFFSEGNISCFQKSEEINTATLSLYQN